MFVEKQYYIVKEIDVPQSKYESIFKNFDPEKLSLKNQRDEFLSDFGNEFLRIVQMAIKICAYLSVTHGKEPKIKRHHLDNFQFCRLANIAHDFSLSGCRIDKETFFSLSKISSSMDWGNYIHYVKEGYSNHPAIATERPSQMIGICVLLMIDAALSSIKNIGFQKENANAALMAYRFLLDSEQNDSAMMSRHLAKIKSVEVAKSGGDGRAALFEALEAETISLYELDKEKWPSGRHHIPSAAQELTPKIVALSKNRGDLLSTTTKPLEWIRAHVKRNQSKLS